MKTNFKIGFLLLSICMILVMTSVMGVFAAEANISMTVSESEVKVGDTFTVVISNADLNAAGFGVVLDYSAQKELIECTDVTGVDDDEYLGMYYSGRKGAATWIDANVGNDAANTNSDGIFSFGVVTGKATDFFEGTVATLTFTAKSEGTVTFTLTERTSGTDAFDGVVETFTLSITDTPACDHVDTDKTYASNGDDTHKVTCECGEVVNATEDCTGGTASCTAQAKCKNCGDEYGKLAEHSFNNAKGTLKTPGTCVAEAVYAVKCDNCTAESATLTVKGDKDPANHTGKVVYTNNGKTHSATYDCCDADYVKGEAHTYEDHTCVCGAVEPTGWVETDGDWYYVDPVTYVKATGLVRVPYPTEKINGITYAADEEALKYYKNEGKTFIDAETALFVFDENGKFQSSFTGIVNNSYAANGMLVWNPGLVVVEGELYYFIGDEVNGGNTPANGDTYIIRANGVAGFVYGDVYNFVNGELSGLNGIVGGKYYENSKLMRGAGLLKLDEGYIYVRSNGEVATGEYWVTKTNGLVNAAMYNFGTDGILVSTVDPSVNGLVDGVYYKNGMPYYAGLIEIDGETYYVKSNGEVATGTYFVTKVSNYDGELNIKSGDKLVFNEDGTMQPIKNGIVDEGGVLYYYVNNHIQYGAGLLKLDDGSIIYVRSNGQLAIGEYWPTTLNGVLPEDKYFFDKNGKLVTE